MPLNRKIYKTKIDNEELELEISDMAGQADAAVLGRWGETVVLATVVLGKNDVLMDYFPLTVDYEERFYAAGKIIGSRFIRREGRPSDEAVLSGRLIDRSIRPLFDKNLRREVQIVVTVLAYDEKNDPDLVSLISVSTALGISGIPWNGPVGGARFEKKDDDSSYLYRGFFSGVKIGRGSHKKDEVRVNMIEFEGKEIAEDKISVLFEQAQKEIEELIKFQEGIIKESGKPKLDFKFEQPGQHLRKLVEDFIKDDLADAIRNKTLNELKISLFGHLKNLGEEPGALKIADSLFEEQVDDYVHKQILLRNERPDGRKLDELRPLYAEIGLFKRTHGSGFFMRGNTHVLSIATLAAPSAEQLVETMETSGKRRFMLHYNFPSFSVGEVGRQKGPGRREIGHGALAEKAIRGLIPSKDIFPYTIRIVAETLSSNGSSSMATVCSASMALMDAGVPIKKHIAGIAMGLMVSGDGKHKILTDIQGPEDHHGDMDFKAAGTEAGITAIQLDVKIDGLTKEIFEETLVQTKKARLEIIQVMQNVILEPRKELSQYAPIIMLLKIPKEKIGEVIGPGGKTINGIIAAAHNKAAIDIEEDGTVFVSGEDKNMVEQAFESVKEIVKEYAPGELVFGIVEKILDFGAIVSLGARHDGMVHISELSNGYVKNVSDVVSVGDKVWVKVLRVEQDGRIALSMKETKGRI